MELRGVGGLIVFFSGSRTTIWARERNIPQRQEIRPRLNNKGAREREREQQARRRWGGAGWWGRGERGWGGGWRGGGVHKRSGLRLGSVSEKESSRKPGDNNIALTFHARHYCQILSFFSSIKAEPKNNTAGRPTKIFRHHDTDEEEEEEEEGRGGSKCWVYFFDYKPSVRHLYVVYGTWYK